MSADEVVPADGGSHVPNVDGGQRLGDDTDSCRSQGLWRTVIAGPGRTLAEAFANLERSPQVDQLTRHAKRDLVAARVTLTPKEGEGYWELTRIRNDFYVIILDFLYDSSRFEPVPGDGLIQFQFTLSSEMTLALATDERLHFNRPSLLVWAQAPGVGSSEWIAPRVRERQIAISVRPEFLIEHFLTSVVDMPPQLQEFVSNPHGAIGYCQLPLTAEMFSAATRLINSPLQGKLALMYTEAVTLELLSLAVNGFYSLPAAACEGYTPRVLRCLQNARSVLARELSSPPTLRKLSRAVGMAETALTRGFKNLYGETVFEYSLRCRMQQALTLLRDKYSSVDDVSQAVGYTHPTSFATAFRRYYGVRPIEVRHVKSGSVGVSDRREWNCGERRRSRV